MKKPSAVVGLLFVGSFLAPAPTSACPRLPTLWRLVGEAELIVLARVEFVEIAAPTVETYDTVGLYQRDVAVLRVLETWKGRSGTEVRVQFQSFIGAAFREGDIVLAFLQSGETRAANALAVPDEEPSEAEWLEAGFDSDEYREMRETAAQRRKEIREFAEWSAGRWFDLGPLFNEIDRPAESQRSVLKELVELAIRLHAAEPNENGFRREWFLAAAERRITREESVSFLLWMTRRPVDPDDESDGPHVDPLVESELARLAAGFVREPSVGFHDVMMLKLLAGYPDLEVDRTAAAVVDAGLLMRPIPGWVPAMVDEALKRYGDNFADRIGRDDRDPRGRPIYTGEGENTLPTIWEVARRELGIPQVPPAVAPVREAPPE